MSKNDIPPGVMNSSILENAHPGSCGNSVMGPVENSNRNDGIFGKGKEDTVQDSRRMQVEPGDQIYAGCNSMLVQLTDTSGKNKSQRVIIVEKHARQAGRDLIVVRDRGQEGGQARGEGRVSRRQGGV